MPLLLARLSGDRDGLPGGSAGAAWQPLQVVLKIAMAQRYALRLALAAQLGELGRVCQGSAQRLQILRRSHGDITHGAQCPCHHVRRQLFGPRNADGQIQALLDQVLSVVAEADGQLNFRPAPTQGRQLGGQPDLAEHRGRGQADRAARRLAIVAGGGMHIARGMGQQGAAGVDFRTQLGQ